MTWVPISGTLPQFTTSGEQANGYVLKFYQIGTTTPLTVSSSPSGTPTTTDFVLDTQGYTTLSGARVIPHVNTGYKIIMYLNQADADANNTGSAVWTIDNINLNTLSETSVIVENVTQLAAVDTDVFTAAYALGRTTISDGGQGWYYFNSSSVLADNGTTIIEPDVGTGRWLFQNNTFNSLTVFEAGGTADAITISTAPAATNLDETRIFYVRNTAGANTVTNPTLQLNSTSATVIKRNGGGDLNIGDLGAAGYIWHLKYDDDEAAYIILNPAKPKVLIHYYTSNGIFTPQSSTYLLDFTAVGGGGGAGGVDGQGGNTGAGSTGGGGGAAVLESTTTIDATYAIVVGSGGTGRSGTTDGDDGGTTSVTSASMTLTANGGKGGKAKLADTTYDVNGSDGGSASGGTVNIDGGASSNANGDFTGATVISNSGASIFGGSVRGRKTATAGLNASSKGAGGGATIVLASDSSNYSGGNGSPGIVIIKEYL